MLDPIANQAEIAAAFERGYGQDGLVPEYRCRDRCEP